MDFYFSYLNMKALRTVIFHNMLDVYKNKQ